jgi:hypothetical protein
MIGFKGFDNTLKCRDFQYELGKTYTHKGTVNLCFSGFHFCENPFDVWSYYGPTNRFAQVEAEGVSKQTESDSKRVAKTLHIEAELTLPGFIGAGVKFILDKADFETSATNTGNYSAATNTGKNGFAINTGVEGKASGALGCYLTLAEWRYANGEYKLITAKTAKVDGLKIKADTFYTLKGGKFVEAA